MFSSRSSKPARGGAAAAQSASGVLAHAAAERARRAAARATRSDGTKVMAFLQSAATRRRAVRALREDLRRKLGDLHTLAHVLKTRKNMDFTPPVATMTALLAQFLFVTSPRHGEWPAKEEGDLVHSVCRWLLRSLRAADAPSSLTAAWNDAATPNAPGRRLSHLLSRFCDHALRHACVMTYGPAPSSSSLESRVCAIHCVSALCGWDVEAASEAAATRATHAHTSMRQSLMRQDARLLGRVRAYLSDLPLDATLRRAVATPDDRAVGVELIDLLCRFSMCTDATEALSTCIVTQVWSIPCAMLRVCGTGRDDERAPKADSAAAASVPAPRIPACCSTEVLAHVAAVLARAARAPLALPPVHVGTRAHPLTNAPVSPATTASPTAPGVAVASASTALTGSSSLGGGGKGVAAFAPSVALTPSFSATSPPPAPLSSTAAAATPSADKPKRKKLPAWSSTAPFDALRAWPVEVFVFGNLLQCLTTPVVGSRDQQVITTLDDASLLSMMRFLSTCVLTLPEEWWGTSTPVLYVKPSKDAAARPVAMPPLLIQQLKCLSSDRMARGLASVCLSMDASLLRAPRLLLSADDDSERGTYDAHTMLTTSSAAGASSTLLAAAPSLASSMWRGMWNGSKLALRALTGSRTSTTAAATPPAEAARTRPAAVPRETRSTSLIVRGSGSAFLNDSLLEFCAFYAMLLAPRPSHVGAMYETDAVVGTTYVLSALTFSPTLQAIQNLWSFLVECGDLPNLVKRQAFKSRFVCDGVAAALTLFCALYGHMLLVLDDFELYLHHTPLPLREVRHVVRLLRDVLAHAEGVGADEYDVDGTADVVSAGATTFWPRFAASAASLLRSLYDRHCLRPLGPVNMWVIDVGSVSLTLGIPAAAAQRPTRAMREAEATRRLMQLLPFTVPFETRARAYEAARAADVQQHQIGFPQVKVTVHRTRLFETAYAALKDVRGDALRRKVYVTFINADGVEESGIDAGGLFKELWTSLAAFVFDPRYGLWAVTEQGELYPHAASHLFSEIPDEQAFEFVGRILGKALYEGITVGPQFARFFLHKLLGRGASLYHLSMLDPELYKSMMFLKTYEGDVADLALTFTVAGDTVGLGQGSDVELVPGGSALDVTASNRMQYIYMMADFRLNKSIQRQTVAFMSGLFDVLPRAWLQPFSAPELQVLISGSLGGIDVEDLQRNTVYDGYWVHDSTIRSFWAVVSEFSAADRAALLRFVTSCERAPPLGFQQLEPKFCIRRAGGGDDHLPSSSTCFHTLKLPAFSSQRVLREKLLLAIHSGAGFELT